MSGFVFFGDAFGLQALGRCKASVECRAVVFDPVRLDRDEAARFGCPTFAHPPKEERQRLIEQLRTFAPATGVICSYSRIIWPELIALFPTGIVNIHNAPLPRYRGANVLQWAIINGDAETAATLHYIDEGVDTGPVIDVESVAIGPEDTALSVRERLLDANVSLLDRWLPCLIEARVPAIAQDESRAMYWRRRTPDDGRIDWTWSDERIRNLTRALVAPWPGAWYENRDGIRVVVDRTLSLDEIASLRRELSS